MFLGQYATLFLALFIFSSFTFSFSLFFYLFTAAGPNTDRRPTPDCFNWLVRSSEISLIRRQLFEQIVVSNDTRVYWLLQLMQNGKFLGGTCYQTSVTYNKCLIITWSFKSNASNAPIWKAFQWSRTDIVITKTLLPINHRMITHCVLLSHGMFFFKITYNWI